MSTETVADFPYQCIWIHQAMFGYPCLVDYQPVTKDINAITKGQDDMRHGKGILAFDSGQTFDGNFENGRPLPGASLLLLVVFDAVTKF